MTVGELAAKYKAPSQPTSTPVVAPSPNTQVAPMTVSQLAAKYQNYQPTTAPTPAPQQPQSLGQKFFNGAQNFATGVAKSEIKTATTLGTGVSDVLSKVPGGIGKFFGAGVQEGKAVSTSPVVQSQGTAQKVGEITGDIAPYFTGVGEEEGAATGAKVLAKTGSKVASWLADHAITGAANTTIGTAQTGSLKQGAETAVAAEVGQTALGKVGSYLKNAAGKATSKIIDALTPKLTPTEYKAAAASGKLAEPGLTSGAGLKGAVDKDTMRAFQGVQDAAAALGKKTTDIVKTGVGQITKNVNRLVSTIGDYSSKVISPMLEKNPVPYNHQDMIDALNLITPSSSLKGDPAATQTYNRIRESVLQTMADSIKGISQKTGNFLNSTDFNAIWNSRKGIDNKIEEELGASTFGTSQYTGVKAAATDMRAGIAQFMKDSFRYAGQMDKINKMNDFIKESVGRGIQISEDMMPALKKQFGIVEDPAKAGLADSWDKSMTTLSSLYDGVANLSSKVGTERGKSYFNLFAKSHPMVTKAVGGAAAGAAAAIGAGGVYEGGKDLLGQ